MFKFFRILLPFLIVFNSIGSCVYSEEATFYKNNEQICSVANNVKSDNEHSQNYIMNATAPGAKIVRWQKMPISVYVPENKHSETIKSAFYEWQKSTNGLVSFNFINSSVKSNISVSFVNNLAKPETDKYYQAALTKPYYIGYNLIKSEILLLEQNPVTKNPYTNEKIYYIVLHEIGHAIGIIGHSAHKGDLMYYDISSPKQEITARDLNTLKIIYTSQQKDYKPDPEVIQQKIDEAKGFVKMLPNNSYGWLTLGDMYRGQEKYREAIDSYNTAIKIDSDYSQAFYGLGLCYYKMQNFEMSYKYFETALKQEGGNTKFINAYTKLCIKTNRKKNAQKYLQTYLKSHPDLRDDVIIQDSLKMLTK